MHGNTARIPRSRWGVSLLEIVTVTTLAGLVLAMGVPKLVAFRDDAAADNAAHEIARDLARARVEALKRNQPVSLRRLGDTAYAVRFEASRRLPHGVVFASGSVDSVRFAPFGVVQFGAGQIIIRAGSGERKVIVRTSGHVEVK